MRNWITNSYEEHRIRALRSAYRRVADVRSEQPGYDGMVDEIREGTALLADDLPRLHAADHAVLEAAFFGPFAVAFVRSLSRRFPERMANALSAIAPAGFGFMVGGLERSADRANFVPHCRFRATGGDTLCRGICKAGTERFCAEHVVPIRLEPSATDMSCTWTWGHDEGVR